MKKNGIEQITKIFETMGNKKRVDIMIFLKNPGGRGFEEIRRMLNINNGTVSFHLKKLTKAELVVKSGRYHITDLGKKALYIFEIFKEMIDG